MADHYYTKRPTAAHDRIYIEETLKGLPMKLITDAGVFSKKGIDFGSKLLIETMDIQATDLVLDMGCGYGPIGLAAARMATRGSVTMVDINERALALATENAALNRIDNVKLLQSDIFTNLVNETYTVILTNPPIRAGKAVVHRIFSESWDHLQEGGQLWVVIQTKQGAASAFAKLQTHYNRVEEVCKSKGYRIFKAVK